MTRINLIPVTDLADQHLFAEWREIKMVPAALRRSLKTRAIGDILRGIPTQYTLNKGHVTFFYNKMLFLYARYAVLTDELLNRGYKLTEHDKEYIFFRDIPDKFRQIQWSPNPQEIEVSVSRILLRISEKPNWYKYYGNAFNVNYEDRRYGFS